MRKSHSLFRNGVVVIIAVVVLAALPAACTQRAQVDVDAEMAAIEQAINDGIGWAIEKDLDLLYSRIAQDDKLLIINPDSSQIEGFEAFQQTARDFWMDPRFKATHFEVMDLRITLSESGTVAWFYCLLDDFGEWDGQKIGWDNVRWSGVLEKRAGRWVQTQMHFSFPQGQGG
jgi:hypothetical protein